MTQRSMRRVFVEEAGGFIVRIRAQPLRVRSPPGRAMTDQTPEGIKTESEAPCFAYMLLTHKDPHHVEELASRILELSPAGHVVIHHDLAAGDLPWHGNPPGRVHFVERGRVLWGDWSIVAATLRMIRFAHEDLGADWFVMLSGEHRPVVDLRQWERSIMASGVDAYAEAEALPANIHFGRSGEDPNRFLARCLHHWVTLKEPRFASGNKVLSGFWRVSRYVLPFCVLSTRIDDRPGLSACLAAAAGQKQPPSTKEPNGSGSTTARPTPSWERTQQ